MKIQNVVVVGLICCIVGICNGFAGGNYEPSVKILEGNTSVLVPISLESAKLDLFIRPIDFHRVRFKNRPAGDGKTKVVVETWASNACSQDYFVIVTATLIDRDGNVVITKSKKGSLEEDDNDKKIKVKYELPSEVASSIETVRLEFAMEPDRF